MNKSIHIFFCIAVYLLFVQAVSRAQEVNTMQFSLQQAKEYALNYSYQVKNAEIDIEVAKETVKQTTAVGLPQISAKFSYSYLITMSEEIEQFSGLAMMPVWMYNVDQALNEAGILPYPTMEDPGNPEPMDVDDMRHNPTLSFTVSQLLFSGPYLIGLQASKTYKKMSELQLDKTKLDVEESVTNSYFMVLVLSENKKILDTTLANINNTLHEIEAMYEVGFVEDTDVDQLRLTAKNIETGLKTLERQVEVARRLLKFQMGISLDQSIKLSDDINELIKDLSLKNLHNNEFIIEDNINYQMLEVGEELAILDMKRYKSEYLPNVAAFYSHEEVFNENAFTFNPPDIVGVSVSIPIFSSGQRRAKLKQAELKLQQTRVSKMQAKEGLNLEFKQAQTNYLSAYEKFLNQQESMEISKKIYDKTLIKYKEGVSSSMDLTQAQNQYLDANSKYYQAILELLNAKTKIDKLINKN